jgi:hypothetical protein
MSHESRSRSAVSHCSVLVFNLDSTTIDGDCRQSRAFRSNRRVSSSTVEAMVDTGRLVAFPSSSIVSPSSQLEYSECVRTGSDCVLARCVVVVPSIDIVADGKVRHGWLDADSQHYRRYSSRDQHVRLQHFESMCKR